MNNDGLDTQGYEFKPGQRVMYPGRQGSSLWVTFAEIKRVRKRSSMGLSGKLITRYELNVQPESNQWNDTKNLRAVTLTCLDRVTIYTPPAPSKALVPYVSGS